MGPCSTAAGQTDDKNGAPQEGDDAAGGAECAAGREQHYLQLELSSGQVMHIILVARSLTRVWRRSINIAEQVYFISQGESVKHKGEERQGDTRPQLQPAPIAAPDESITMLHAADEDDEDQDSGSRA